jgi:hypothetical protein
MRRLVVALVGGALALSAAVPGVGPGDVVGGAEAAGPTPYWELRGCQHADGSAPWHRSKVAYRRTTRILKNHSTFTRAEGRQVRHYVACVATRKKSRAVARHVAELRQWRRANVCTTAGGNVRLAECMARRDYGWVGGQWSCLFSLWDHESAGTWSPYVSNYGGSGALGIAQALPGSKYATAIRYPGETIYSPVVQIRWGLGYIDGRYGTPCGAYGHLRSANWY